MRSNDLLDCYSLSKAFEWISSFQLLKFCGSVLIEELVDRQEAPTNFDLDLVTLYFDHDTLRPEFVNAFGLS